MAKQNKSKYRWIWLVVIALVVCVASTTIAFMGRMNSFMPDDSGAMPLIPEGYTEDSVPDTSVSGDNSNSSDASSEGEDQENNPEDNIDSASVDETNETEQLKPYKVGFEVFDDNGVWHNETEIEIFSISYEDGAENITVNSSNGDAVIAPGTENSYTFKLKNTGQVCMDYTVSVEAFFTPEDVSIPVTTRLSRYDGHWVVGDQDVYEEVPELDGAQDSAKLGAGKYTYYTLDWVWPFESGDDEYDTLLGNTAVGQDLTFTIVIRSYATVSSDEDGRDGIGTPDTGDNSQVALMIAIAAFAFVMIIILLILKLKDRKCEDDTSEGDKS